MKQTQGFLNQSQSTDPGGETIVNEQEQDKEVNSREETFEGTNQETAYSEGQMNNSDTDTEKPVQPGKTIADLPGSEVDPEKEDSSEPEKD